MYTGACSFLNASSVILSNFRKAAPTAPVKMPRQRNHGNWVRLVKSNGGTVYHGLIPQKLRDTIVATTDANTSGANKFIEKLPSTISAAKTAPEIGAL